jgi:hypothetical protein
MLARVSPDCPDRLKRTSTDRTEIVATGNNAPPKIGRIASPTRNSYTRKLPELEPLFAYFTRKKLPRNAISEIAHDTGIPGNTRYDWRPPRCLNLLAIPIAFDPDASPTTDRPCDRQETQGIDKIGGPGVSISGGNRSSTTKSSKGISGKSSWSRL